MSELYLIRHGQASLGATDYDELLPNGRRQARILGERLLRVGIRFDACFAGTLKRQRQTADEMQSTYQTAGIQIPDPVENAAFDEYDAEAIMRRLMPEIKKEEPAFSQKVDHMRSNPRMFQEVFEQVMNRWVTGDDRLPHPLSWAAFLTRVASGIRELVETIPQGKSVAVFTSGGVIGAAVGSVLGLATEKMVLLSWQVANASITRFKFNRSRISLATFNDIGHLENSGETGLVTYR